jgi:hypothetical protein
MPTFIYAGESPRLYPYPPIARILDPGDEVELDEEQVPGDGRFQPAGLCTEADLARLRALAARYREDAAPDEAGASVAPPPADEQIAPAAPAAAKTSKTPKE